MDLSALKLKSFFYTLPNALVIASLLFLFTSEAEAKPPYEVIAYVYNSNVASTTSTNDGAGAAINWTTDVPWNDLTQVADAFMVPKTNFTFSNGGAKGSVLVTAAHNNNTRCILSLGGSMQDTAFKSLCSSAGNITSFTQAVTAYVVANNYDGVDIDWEQDQNVQAQATAMMQSLYTALKALPNCSIDGKPHTLAFTTVNYIENIYNMTTLGSCTDWCFYMGYDWYDGTDNSNGPLNGVSPSITSDVTGMTGGGVWSYPISKFILGCPLYTNDYNAGTEIDTLSILHLGTAGTYNTSYAEQAYTDPAGNQVFVDTAQSYCDKINWGIGKGMKGIGMWDLGQGLPYTDTKMTGIWSAIAGQSACLTVVGATATFTHSPTPVPNTPTRTMTMTSTSTTVPNTATRTQTMTSTSTSAPNTATRTQTSTSTTAATNTRTSTSTLTSTSTSAPNTSTPTNPPNTATRTSTNTSTTTRTNTVPAATNTATSTLTSTNTALNTNTPTLTATGTVPSTNTQTSTGTSTSTSTPANTSTQTFTASSTPSNSPTKTYTHTSTPTSTATLGSTATSTSSNTATVPVVNTSTMTSTPRSTATSTSTSTSTSTVSRTQTPTSTFTAVFTSTATPTSTSTGTATFTPGTSNCGGIPAWNGNFVAYHVGQEVSYNGEAYTCIQSHTSESTWMPPVVPALWKDLGACGSTPASTVQGSPVVYPNPVTGPTVNLQLPLADASGVKVQLYTISFREVQTLKFAQVTGSVLSIPLMDRTGRSLADGLYYFAITINGTRWIEKVLVLR